MNTIQKITIKLVKQLIKICIIEYFLKILKNCI